MTFAFPRPGRLVDAPEGLPKEPDAVGVIVPATQYRLWNPCPGSGGRGGFVQTYRPHDLVDDSEFDLHAHVVAFHEVADVHPLGAVIGAMGIAAQTEEIKSRARRAANRHIVGLYSEVTFLDVLAI